MMLSQLIPEVTLNRDVLINGISEDSRGLEKGNLFLAMPGLQRDGREFIADVADRASAILCEAPLPDDEFDVPIIGINDLRIKSGTIASRFFGNPSGQMKVVAVTGTNGKTSVSNYIAAAVNGMGCRCGVIGTLGVGTGTGQFDGTGLTTPDAITLQSSLAFLLQEGCSITVLEASSHGLSQGRLNGTEIDVAVFTNLTRDHLDYHENFAAYLNAKRRLFEWPGLKTAVINKGDDNADAFASVSPNTVFYGFRDADVVARSMDIHGDGLSFELVTPWGSQWLKSSLLGRFNISNLLAAASVLGVLGFDFEDMTKALGDIRNVTGRMHTLTRDGLPTIVIDYAHTPDALAHALIALREHCRGALWCVFGCGGDRDRGKRPQMGAIAALMSDHIVVTDDNPRNENPGSIINDILAGIDDFDNVVKSSPRSKAIAHAILNAGENDMVLIAGKGHESYQEIRGKREPFSDFEEVRHCFEQYSAGLT